MATALTPTEQSLHFLERVAAGPPAGPIEGEAAWTAETLGDPQALFETLTPAAIETFERAMDVATQQSKPLELIGPEDFTLGGIETELTRWRNTLARGRGMLLLRGVPVERWGLDQQKLFMVGLGLQFGRLGHQNPQGDLIGEVKDTKAEVRDPFARKYATAAEFKFHCDAADLLGLLCVRPAAHGGQSRVASSVAVYNELRRVRPQWAERLFQPIRLDLRNEQAPGTAPFTEVTPCAYANGRLSTFYISDYFRSVTRHGLAMAEEDAGLLDLYDAIAGSPSFGLAFHLRRGDVQILNNHVTLHARGAFEDTSGSPGRLLLRFLASIPRQDAP